MTENECISRMIAPGTHRPGKYRGGVIQIHVTRACNLACFHCTQGSQLGGKVEFISLDHFEQACQSLTTYNGVVGIFGGCPTLHNKFDSLCEILCRYIPREQRGLWANNLHGHGAVCRRTFNPSVSNLNVHLDKEAYAEFKRDWPESQPFGLHQDSRHSPCYVAMKDVLKKVCPKCQLEREAGLEDDGGSACELCHGTGQVYDEGKAWELISNCDINRNWSALLGIFRGQLRGWFCEIAGAQAMLHQHEPDYPDTGYDVTKRWVFDGSEGKKGILWWELPMKAFTQQVRHHCHSCSVPLRGHGELAQAAEGTEQVSQTHADVYVPKRKGRSVELVTVPAQLGPRLAKMTDYIGNASR